MGIRGPIVAAVALLMGTVVLAQSTTHDFDRDADFRSFTSFAWVRGTELADRFNHERIVAAVDAQLSAKGMRRVDAGAVPDVLVAYHASFDRDLRITGFSSGFGPYRLGRSGVAQAEDILTGTIVVDIVDARTKRIVWRGTASKEIDVEADPTKRTRNINRAAARLFNNYPPVK